MDRWSSLPGELLQLIAEKLSTVEDFMALTSVCRYFRSAVKKDQWHPCEVFQPPWLLTSSGSALSMYTNKRLKLNLLAELGGKHFFQTTMCGWLVALCLNQQLYFFNPLNQRRITLPLPKVAQYKFGSPIPTMRYKVILIKRPPFGVDDFVVVACTYDGYLIVTRRPQEENTWETVKLNPYAGMSDFSVRDMTYYEGQIYVVGLYGRILVFSNLDGPGPLIQVDCVPGDINKFWKIKKLHLVVSMGDILLVAQGMNEASFDVFKFNHETKTWAVVDDLGDRTLFVCDSQSISLSSPENFNYRRNCIYSTVNNIIFKAIDKGIEQDMCIFDLKGRTIQLFNSGCRPPGSDGKWFIPTFS